MDATSLYVLSLSLLPIAVAVAIFMAQRDRLGLFHIWLALVALSYGAYTFVDVLVNGAVEIDEWTVTALMLSVTASMFVTFLAFISLPRHVSDGFSVKNVVWEVEKTGFTSLVFVWLLVIGWHAYAYSSYGIVANYDPDTVASLISFDIPSWVGPVRQLFIAIGFSVFIWLVARVARKGNQELFGVSLLMLIVIAVLLSLNGRRVFLHLLIVGGIVFTVARGQFASILTGRNVFRGIAVVVLFVAFSNVFQSVRNVYLVHNVLRIDTPTAAELANAVFDIEATSVNLESRVAVWRFHYAIMSAQARDLGDVMGGELVKAGFLGAIPRALYPDKGVVAGDDVLVCEHYAVLCPNISIAEIDYPQTLLSGMQADFGLFFVLLVPFCILAVLLVVRSYGQLSKRGKISPVLYILVFGAAAELLVNVEQSVGNYFIWMRDIAILTLSIGLLGFVGRLLLGTERIRA